MSVSVLLLTHDDVGNSILKAATRTMGQLPLKVLALPISKECDPDIRVPQIKRVIEDLQSDDGVLILTDLYGATPYNVAKQFNNGHSVKVVSGVNLSMLLKVLNYSQLSLDELSEKACCGGREGVVQCENYCNTELK